MQFPCNLTIGRLTICNILPLNLTNALNATYAVHKLHMGQALYAQYAHYLHLALNVTYETVMGVPVPYKRDRSLITWDRSLIAWDRSQKDEYFGTGPIKLIIGKLNGGNHIFWIIVVLLKL